MAAILVIFFDWFSACIDSHRDFIFAHMYGAKVYWSKRLDYCDQFSEICNHFVKTHIYHYIFQAYFDIL